MSREDEIKARLEKATKGPWVIRFGGREGDTGFCIASKMVPAGIVCEHWPVNEVDARLANGHFIANAPADIDYLLAENARLRSENEELRKEVSEYVEITAADTLNEAQIEDLVEHVCKQSKEPTP